MKRWVVWGVEAVSLLVTQIPAGPLSCAFRIQQKFSIIRSQTVTVFLSCCCCCGVRITSVFHPLFVRIRSVNRKYCRWANLLIIPNCWGSDVKLHDYMSSSAIHLLNLSLKIFVLQIHKVFKLKVSGFS